MIKGILFDKDGTLVEFNTLWIDSTHTMIESIVKEYANGYSEEKYREITGKIGLHGNKVKEDSIIAGKTSDDLAEVIANVLDTDKSAIHERVNTFYYQSVVENSQSIQAIGDLPSLFKKLKEQGLKIGIVTADNFDVTDYTIEKLGIDSYVDFVATADLYEKKPGPGALEAFCEKFDLQPEEVIHIGDTNVDMEFSKHALLGVGVLSGVSSEETLRKYTPHVIGSVTDLVNEKGELYLDRVLNH